MNLRIIAVQAGNETKKFPNDTRHFFLLWYLQTVVNYDSFEGKVLVLL